METDIQNECEKILQYQFKNQNLLAQALTHSSSKHSVNGGNERLEYLGDAVLGLVVSEYLFKTFENYQEGELTRIKSAVVSGNSLAQVINDIGIVAFVSIGKGLAMKARIPMSVLANVYEAIVAAIYLDDGLDAASKFCIRTLEPLIMDVDKRKTMRNYKSLLQQYSQKRFGVMPDYHVSSERGPEHLKSFKVEVKVNGEVFKAGWGRSKKDAEMMAAQVALEALSKEFPDDEILIEYLSSKN
ncbi:MAG: ribonuclease III [Planctomycetes bacterium]|nr:ribonuclease III [Planctomycetota bacterium]